MESKRKRVMRPKVVPPVVPPPEVTLESLLTPEGKRLLNNHLDDYLSDRLTVNPLYTPQWPSAKHADKADRAKKVPWLIVHAALWPTLAACIVLVLVSVSDHRELRDILVRMNKKMAGLTFVKTVEDASHITLEHQHEPEPSSGSGYSAPVGYAAPAASELAKPEYIHIHLQESCWLSVEKFPTVPGLTVPGLTMSPTVLKQGTMPKDYEHSFYWKPGWTLSIRSGCPGKVDYSHNGGIIEVSNESKTPSKSEVVTFPL